ncbi:MAG: lysine-2,3-aminomutase-like protein [Alphaproteobacteria bacterium]
MNVVRNLVQSLNRRRLRSAADLAMAGLIPPDRADTVARAAGALPVALTPDIAGLIDVQDPDDPIARQFIPDAREAEWQPGEHADPIGDGAHQAVKGVIHRYPDRALLTPLLTCPVYCRFCFRREQVGAGALSEAELDAALDYIQSRNEIWEVILSGGDPLALSDRRLDRIIGALDAIDHVEVIRIHSRVPAVDPGRVTEALANLLKRDTPVYVVLHCNHARELTDTARAAISRLVDGGIPMLSQTVLLKGVNDNAADMEALMRALVRCRVKPYYLHHPDLARGTGHFRTTLAAGQTLMRRLRGRLSGIAQPTYILDIPGGFGKAPVGPGYLETRADGAYLVKDWQGGQHCYQDSAQPIEPPTSSC